ncbi:hypothetical protein N7522_012183 [Penicillium canescens]|nr:hypothetical protein N7522_012183 [Penicillium canescens]
MAVFVTKGLEILTAPLEWALESKLRRIHAVNRDRRAELDMSAALSILWYLRDRDMAYLTPNRLAK